MHARLTGSGAVLLLGGLSLAASLGCPGKEPSGPEDNTGGSDLTAPAITSTTPGSNGSGVNVRSVVSATFSESMDPSSINAASFTLGGGVTGTVSYADRTATLTPSADLLGGTTYTATITTAARDLAGNPMAQAHSWSFATAAPPVPVAGFPFVLGKRWRYEGRDSTTYCAASTGCGKIRFAGAYILHAEGQEEWHGRSAWRMAVYQLPTEPGSDPGVKASVLYLAQTSTGLERWANTSTGGEWRTILSRTGATYGNGAFLLHDGPAHGDAMTLSASSATVPAGTFPTVKVMHEYKETGEYATRDIFETLTEEYADGVGLVRGQWDYSFDDNDPRATDLIAKGEVKLTHIDEGPMPDLVAEQEPNDTSTQATAGSAFMIARGGTLITDPGSLLTDAGVGCTAQCIFPNKNGEKRIQDWYRLVVTASRAVRIDLVYETFTGDRPNDLDLYAFSDEGAGPRYLAVSAADAATPEMMSGTLAPGTYYFAVQAWDTPGGRVAYWLSVR